MASKLVVCASGDGSNFEALVIASRATLLQAEIVGLICDSPKARALARAERLKIPVQIIGRNDDEKMLEKLREWSPDWVVLAGFLSIVGPKVLQAYKGRIVNSHPALLPKYGGKGMYGMNVHRAVIGAKEVESGVTIHLVEEGLDSGPVLAQAKVNVWPGDTAESLSERIKRKERAFYPAILNSLVTGRITSH